MSNNPTRLNKCDSLNRSLRGSGTAVRASYCTCQPCLWWERKARAGPPWSGSRRICTYSPPSRTRRFGPPRTASSCL